MPTVREILSSARDELANAGIESPRLTAELMLAEVLGCARGELVQHGDVVLTPAQVGRLDGFVQRRLMREPVDYIIGHREFYGRRFITRPGALVPRPETETIIDLCKKRLPKDLSGWALDVGTGAGPIAVTLALEFPRLRVIATDISIEALRIARENAVALGVASRVLCIQMDGMAAVHADARLPLITCNPPYVNPADRVGMQPEVAVHEPEVALFAGNEGLELSARFLPQAFARLAPDGLALFEFGFAQGDRAAALARQAGFKTVELRPDLTGMERTLELRR